MAAARLRVLLSHVDPCDADCGNGVVPAPAAAADPMLTTGGRAALGADGLDFLNHLEGLPDRTRELEGYDVSTHLPGPQHDLDRYATKYDVIKEQIKQQLSGGEEHLLFSEWQQRYGDAGPSSNLVMPNVVFGRNRMGKSEPPFVNQQVLICHPDDCERLARTHIQKQPQYSTTVLSSLVAARENEHWLEQRRELMQPFMPLLSLAPLFPKSVERAKVGADRLAEEVVKGGGVVDMHDFLMYEAFAQLMHTLVGETDEFQHKHSKAIRDAWILKIDPGYLKEYALEFLPRVQDAAKSPDCPPLTKVLGETSQDPITLIGNLVLFSVAGHDTTGNTLSFLMFELARHPEHQRALQKEVDGLAAEVGGRDLELKDLKKLPFMTRCITETLRMWPAVPQGTYKMLQHDDVCCGPGGKLVQLPKGTMVQICTWQLHRNPQEWGPDAHVFNPNREYLPCEVFGEQVFMGENPCSRRFSPFQYPPRDCLGRNFSMLEQRAVLFHFLRRFSFELTEPYQSLDPKQNIGVHYGTMGPRDLSAPHMEKHWLNVDRAPYGLPMKVIPRTTHWQEQL